MRDIKKIIRRTEEWISSQRIHWDQGETSFSEARKVAEFLGATYSSTGCLFGVWAPEIEERGLDPESFRLELFSPLEAIDFRSTGQRVRFRKEMIPMVKKSSFFWVLLEDVQGGRKEKAGDFYRFSYLEKGQRRIIHDPLAMSLPFGVFSPGEIYDWEELKKNRRDRRYFERLKSGEDSEIPLKLKAPANLLQIHPGTATPEGTIEALTRLYRSIAGKIREGVKLEPFEINFAEYDGIQLMPIEPIIEYENREPFWITESVEENEAIVHLTPPDMTNWGYDILISGMGGINPVLLGSKRPDEFIEFIEVLHDFPEKPVRVVLDVVFGHSDNQGLKALNHNFFTGSNMYGQDMNFRHPVVRSILLEMQRRKGNFGIDGLRVDGAQDFKYYDEEKQELLHDDEYLQLMSDVKLEVCNTVYHPWMIFEDGRPWPRQDWELASTYRSVIDQQPGVWQWGPLTFAHNTPFLYTFWATRWWRVREIMERGSRWITGCSNHDTLRRGSQVSPEEKINNRLGHTLQEIIEKAYDNSGEKIITYGLMPGIPMDFINASMKGPWSFIRNTDDLYGVKVVSEEKSFLDWRVPRERYDKDGFFTGLKDMGFNDYQELYKFMEILEKAVELTGSDLGKTVGIVNHLIGKEKPWMIDKIKRFARAWMDDVHHYCKIHHYSDEVERDIAEFHHVLRRFRRERPWLSDNLREDEFYGYLHPALGSVIYYGLRRSPDGREVYLFISHMEGEPKTITVNDLPIQNCHLDYKKLKLYAASPGLTEIGEDGNPRLNNGEGLILWYNDESHSRH